MEGVFVLRPNTRQKQEGKKGDPGLRENYN